MIIGVPKEIKDNEYRIGTVPASVKALCEAGHTVLVQDKAGEGSGITNEELTGAGAKIVKTAEEVWKQADMIIKVKEPIKPEWPLMREDQILYTYLHLAPVPDLTAELLKRKVAGVAYETITDSAGKLPLLIPMSEVAGRMSIQVGAQFLESPNGGKGVLLGGVPGVSAGKVTVIGGGTVGIHAARMAVGLGAKVNIIELDPVQLRWLDNLFQGRAATLMSNSYNIAESVRTADLVVGGVLIPGASAPKLVTRKMISQMKPGSVVVDVAVDQGGCFETTTPTTHSKPTFVVDGVIHYCVANMPGAVPRTSTYALTNVTLKYALMLANLGLKGACLADPGLANGVNTYKGKMTCRGVAESQKLEYTSLEHLL
jgi:alanine dehydrogenase